MSDDLRDAYASIYKKPQQVDEDMGIISIPATLAAIGTAAKAGGAALAAKGAAAAGAAKAGGAALAAKGAACKKLVMRVLSRLKKTKELKQN